MDFSKISGLRPAAIKTYRAKTYDRISPLTSTFDAKGKTLLITAGGMSSLRMLLECTDNVVATGVGYSISESFAQAGVARIIIVQRRESVLAAAAESLNRTYPDTEVETYAASQSDFARMTEIITSTGEIDVLVACVTNTGSAVRRTMTRDNTFSELTDVYNVNVLGMFHMVREFLVLPSTGVGRKTVLHVSAVGVQFYTPGRSVYASSKTAATQLITHFAYDRPDGNVKFYSFHPGAIYTPAASAVAPKAAVAWEDPKLPGDFAVWLASPEADFLNGRYLWAQWDVDDLIALKERVAKDPKFLTMTLGM